MNFGDCERLPDGRVRLLDGVGPREAGKKTERSWLLKGSVVETGCVAVRVVGGVLGCADVAGIVTDPAVLARLKLAIGACIGISEPLNCDELNIDAAPPCTCTICCRGADPGITWALPRATGSCKGACNGTDPATGSLIANTDCGEGTTRGVEGVTMEAMPRRGVEDALG